MPGLKITHVRLRTGLTFSPGRLTVLVGPNNVGKTRILRDILSSLVTDKPQQGVLVEDTGLEFPGTLPELKQAVSAALRYLPGGETRIRTLGSTLLEANGEFNLGLPENWEPQAEVHMAFARQGRPHPLGAWFGPHFLSFLRTDDRLRLVSRFKTALNPGEVPNLLVALYREQDPAVAERLDTFFDRAFGLHIRLDYSELGQIVLRVGQDFGGLPVDQRFAAPLFQKFAALDDQGDGMRSFVGCALALLVGNRSVVLLDEPEAFLHPPQCVQIGEMIDELATPDRQIIVATHNADVLRGLLNRGGQFDIIRLTRKGDETRPTLLPADQVRYIATDPVLSTTRVLEGLFYNAAVVVEADSDSAFYSRVARHACPEDEILYMRAHNKQTIHKLIRPYARLGVEAAAIADIDVIRRADELKPLLQSLTKDPLDEPLRLQNAIRAALEGRPVADRLVSIQRVLRSMLDEWHDPVESDAPATLSRVLRELRRIQDKGDSWEELKHGGSDVLTGEVRLQFDQLLRWCSSRGLFIVPVGELEGWLVRYGIPRLSDKSVWIVTALTKLAELAGQRNAEGPWSFVRGIHDYLLKRSAVAESS